MMRPAAVAYTLVVVGRFGARARRSAPAANSEPEDS
jgi:hypothetical protein